MYALFLLHGTFFFMVVVATLLSFLSPQINAVKNEKVENLNQLFTQVQRDVTSVSKSVAPQPKKQTQVESSKATPFMAFLKM